MISNKNSFLQEYCKSSNNTYYSIISSQNLSEKNDIKKYKYNSQPKIESIIDDNIIKNRQYQTILRSQSTILNGAKRDYSFSPKMSILNNNKKYKNNQLKKKYIKYIKTRKKNKINNINKKKNKINDDYLSIKNSKTKKKNINFYNHNNAYNNLDSCKNLKKINSITKINKKINYRNNNLKNCKSQKIFFIPNLLSNEIKEVYEYDNKKSLNYIITKEEDFKLLKKDKINNNKKIQNVKEDIRSYNCLYKERIKQNKNTYINFYEVMSKLNYNYLEYNKNIKKLKNNKLNINNNEYNNFFSLSNENNNLKNKKSLNNINNINKFYNDFYKKNINSYYHNTKTNNNNNIIKDSNYIFINKNNYNNINELNIKNNKNIYEENKNNNLITKNNIDKNSYKKDLYFDYTLSPNIYNKKMINLEIDTNNNKVNNILNKNNKKELNKKSKNIKKSFSVKEFTDKYNNNKNEKWKNQRDFPVIINIETMNN